LPVPSNSIVNEVQKLFQSEQVQNDPIVKQSAWFTFGALVNELCQKNNNQQRTPDASQLVQEQCTNVKKEQYKQVKILLKY
jgi:predicted GTPase